MEELCQEENSRQLGIISSPPKDKTSRLKAKRLTAVLKGTATPPLDPPPVLRAPLSLRTTRAGVSHSSWPREIYTDVLHVNQPAFYRAPSDNVLLLTRVDVSTLLREPLFLQKIPITSRNSCSFRIYRLNYIRGSIEDRRGWLLTLFDMSETVTMTCTGDEITVIPRRKSLVRFSAGEDAGERPRPIQRIPTRVELTTLTRMAKRPAVDIEFQDLCFTAGQ